MKVTIPAIPFLCGAAVACLSACGPKPGGTGDEPSTSSSGASADGGTTTPPATTGSEPSNPTSGEPTGPIPTGPTSDEPPGETSTPGSSTGSEFIVMPDQGIVEFCDLALQDCGEGLKCNPSGLESSNIFNGPPQCVPEIGRAHV